MYSLFSVSEFWWCRNGWVILMSFTPQKVDVNYAHKYDTKYSIRYIRIRQVDTQKFWKFSVEPHVNNVKYMSANNLLCILKIKTCARLK